MLRKAHSTIEDGRTVEVALDVAHQRFQLVKVVAIGKLLFLLDVSDDVLVLRQLFFLLVAHIGKLEDVFQPVYIVKQCILLLFRHSDDALLVCVVVLPGFGIGEHGAVVQLIKLRKIGQRCGDVSLEHFTGLRLRLLLRRVVVDELGQLVLVRHIVCLVGAHFVRLIEIESL